MEKMSYSEKNYNSFLSFRFTKNNNRINQLTFFSLSFSALKSLLKKISSYLNSSIIKSTPYKKLFKFNRILNKKDIKKKS